jgi:acyl carrier protein
MTRMIYYVGLFALLAALVVAVSIPLAIRDEWKRKRKIKSAFDGRMSLDDSAFFNEYFASRGVPIDVVCRIRSLLARDLDADVSRLQPADDFTGNLQFFFAHDELANVYIVQDLEKEFGISITDDEAARIHTFDDIVMGTWDKLRQRAA